jgi:signal transduction histidine kinase
VPLQQVVLNLITNAVEAMSRVDEHRRHLTIATTCEEDGHITVHLRDTGVGIDARHLERADRLAGTARARPVRSRSSVWQTKQMDSRRPRRR